jgi:transcriptional regulator with XRE-family HTH domain
MNENSVENRSALSDKAWLKQIGQFIKGNRQNQHKPQDQVALEAGISRSTLSLMERGENVRIDSLIQVLRALNLLYVLDSFLVKEQISQIEYAKLKNKQTRIRRKKTHNNDKEELEC